MIEHFPFERFGILAVQEPKKNYSCCGDSYFIKETGDYLLLTVADGLGSGKGARDASQVAIKTAQKYDDAPLEELMNIINDALLYYRGAVVSIFRIDFKSCLAKFCGVGNILLSVFPKLGKPITPLPEQGFLSGPPVKCRVHEFKYPEDAFFVIHSDGVSFRTDQLSAIHRIYEARTDDSECLLRPFSGENDDDRTLIIGKPYGKNKLCQNAF